MRKPIKFEPVAPKRVLLAKLRKAQAPDGQSSMGEMFATAIVSKTKAELRRLVDKLDADADQGDKSGEEMVDAILAASESLKTRLRIVDAAFARLYVVVDGAHNRKGGADV